MPPSSPTALDEGTPAALTALAALWRGQGLAEDALSRIALPGVAQGFASRFAVVQAAQASAGAAALAAT